MSPPTIAGYLGERRRVRRTPSASSPSPTPTRPSATSRRSPRRSRTAASRPSPASDDDRRASGSRPRRWPPGGPFATAIRTIEDGYGLTLILTILTIFSRRTGGVGSFGGVLAVMLDRAATLLFALNTSQARPRIPGADPRRSPSPALPWPSSPATQGRRYGDRDHRVRHRGGRAGRHPAPDRTER